MRKPVDYMVYFTDPDGRRWTSATPLMGPGGERKIIGNRSVKPLTFDVEFSPGIDWVDGWTAHYSVKEAKLMSFGDEHRKIRVGDGGTAHFASAYLNSNGTEGE